MERLTGVAFGFVVMALLRCAAAQTVYVVGDSVGWDVLTGGAQAYITWASGKKFMVGDILTFNFMTNSHDVLRVEKSSFDACTQANPIGDIITTGPVNITLQSPGDHYYICTVGRHCGAGQKLSITVSGIGTPGGSPPPTTSSSPPIKTSPSPNSSKNTPSGAACPTEGPTSSPTTPTPIGTPTTTQTPPNSSASTILGSIFLTLAATSLAFVI